jgi:hypothetical protein
MPSSKIVVQLDQVTNSCFVVMPFEPLYLAEYERVIKPALESAGLACVRGDEIYANQAIVQDIWLSIRRSRMVVAELSGRNPNVMYEIGLAHAIGKPIVFLTRNEDDVPFDLRALRYIFYDTNNPFWGDDLRTELSRLVISLLENPTMGKHLEGVIDETTLPAAPRQPIAPASEIVAPVDLSGVWYATWLSIKREREHQATMVIPTGHRAIFTASMTVTYERSGKQSIVQETLSATFRDDSLTLRGVNYTYIEQGASRGYVLDNFDLKTADGGTTLVGKVTLRHGVRDVTFTRRQQLQE